MGQKKEGSGRLVSTPVRRRWFHSIAGCPAHADPGFEHDPGFPSIRTDQREMCITPATDRTLPYRLNLPRGSRSAPAFFGPTLLDLTPNGICFPTQPYLFRLNLLGRILRNLGNEHTSRDNQRWISLTWIRNEYLI